MRTWNGFTIFSPSPAFQRTPYALSDSFGFATQEQSDPRSHPALVSQTIVRRLKKAGIKGSSLHTLCQTLASHLLSNGVPLTAVSARLGHSDVNVTARIYSHMLPDDDARAADAWESVIGPIQ